jgi:hypothetical protein
LKNASRTAQIIKRVPTIRENILQSIVRKIPINKLKKAPILAANLFGAANTGFTPSFSILTNNCAKEDRIEDFEKKPLNAKSMSKK